jgi:hypothetical protein
MDKPTTPAAAHVPTTRRSQLRLIPVGATFCRIVDERKRPVETQSPITR